MTMIRWWLDVSILSRHHWAICINYHWFFSHHLHTAVDIESIVSQCCNEGNDWGSQRKHCNEYKFNLDKNVVPAGLHGLCLSTVEICCAKQHRIYQCTGKHGSCKSCELSFYKKTLFLCCFLKALSQLSWSRNEFSNPF